MTSPIDRLLDRVDWRCTICKRPASENCDCSVKCSCGTSYQKGKGCRNQACPVGRARWDRALAHVVALAERPECVCALPCHEAKDCGCSPVCACHMDLEEAAEAAERTTR